MTRLWFLLTILLCSLFIQVESAKTASGERPVYEEVYFRCLVNSINGQYTHVGSRYEVHGACYTDNTVIWNWTAQGAYRQQGGKTSDSIIFTAPGLHGGRVDSHMQCDHDPWIETSTCISPLSQSTGEILYSSFTLRGIQETIDHNKKPLATTLKSYSGYPYERGPLLAKRAADLQAAAAQEKADAEAKAQSDLEARNRRLQKGAQQIPLVAPTIVAPLANALFLANTSVPIKIAPPQGMAASLYMVRLESRNAQGAWLPVTSLPVGAAQASSPSGYLEWGAAGNGRGAAMIAGPGTYRVSAQVTAPYQTAWSLPVQFVVTAPNKAIQKTPKTFGP